MLDIKAVTSVCGNQTIEKTTYNAGRIMTLVGLDVPLAMGRVKPLVADAIIAPTVHGNSGLDGPALPEPKNKPVEIDACTLMAQILEQSDEPVVLIPTGPLTNVATLLLLYPHLKSKIKHIYLMGGGIDFGNWTPAAEFNILVDPEAADVVFTSGVPITMAGLDVTEQALVFPEDFERIRALHNPGGDGRCRMAGLLLWLPSQHRLSGRARARRGRRRGDYLPRDHDDGGHVCRHRADGRLLPRHDGW